MSFWDELTRMKELEAKAISGDWHVIADRKDGRTYGGESRPNAAIDPKSLRLVDDEDCLLFRIASDPEQVIRAEDMQFVAKARSFIPKTIQRLEELKEALEAIGESWQPYHCENDPTEPCTEAEGELSWPDDWCRPCYTRQVVIDALTRYDTEEHGDG